MNETLQIIGSVASIIGMPLAIYLYIKSQENKIISVRREIVKILSHLIGENKVIRKQDIYSVINSITNEKRISSKKISIQVVIDDMVTEIIRNPLLNDKNKRYIIDEIKEINLVSNDTLKQERKPSKLREIINHITISNRTTKISTIFGVTASLITIVIFILGKSNINDFNLSNSFSKSLISTFIAFSITIIANVLMGFFWNNKK